jgi:hypothetical protein
MMSPFKRRESMARVRLSPILEQLYGQKGNPRLERYGDRVIVARKPDAEGQEWSESRIAYRERFRQATIYGRLVLVAVEARAIYEETIRAVEKPVFSLTVADFYNAPSVDEIDLSEYTGAVGDRIEIVAHDDFDVVEVNVNLMDAEGDTIESGRAAETPVDSGRWTYTTTMTVKLGTTVCIAVTAKDRPMSTAGLGSETAIERLVN